MVVESVHKQVERRVVPSLFERALPTHNASAPSLTNDTLARVPAGRITEFVKSHASAALSSAMHVVAELQAQGELCAWIQPEGISFYPPDAAHSGVDLNALVVMHIPQRAQGGGFNKVADYVLRSGAFALVVIDAQGVSKPRTSSASSWQGRIANLVRQYHSRLLVLRDQDAQAYAYESLASVRWQPVRVRHEPGQYRIDHRLLKNKTGIHFTSSSDLYFAPEGLDTFARLQNAMSTKNVLTSEPLAASGRTNVRLAG